MTNSTPNIIHMTAATKHLSHKRRFFCRIRNSNLTLLHPSVRRLYVHSWSLRVGVRNKNFNLLSLEYKFLNVFFSDLFSKSNQAAARTAIPL